MGKYEFSKRVIDRHEEMITKEIERYVYGKGQICPTALYERLLECIKARHELNHIPIPKSVEELLDIYNYDQDFIDKFCNTAKNHDPDNCPEL